MSKLKIEDMWGLDPSLKFFTNKEINLQIYAKLKNYFKFYY